MTKETEVTTPDKNLASRDREDAPDQVEVVEDVEIVETKAERDYEDVLREDDDPRAAIYKRHNDKRNAEISEQTGESDEENVDSDEENEKTSVEKAESADIIKSGDKAASTPPDEDPLVEVVIFEQVRQVPQSKIDKAGGIQMYQMREAAQEQMRRNAARARELEERERALDERERSAPTPPAVPAKDQHKGQSPDDLPSDDQTLKDMARQYQEAVYDGDDNAPSILVEMVAKAARSGEKFDENAFRRQVKEEVLADQRQEKVVRARNALLESTPELNKDNPRFDRRLFEATDTETVVLERAHPDWEPEQVLAKAWENVRSWHGNKTTESIEARNREKQELNRPRSATGRHTPPPPQPRKTNSDYVREERIRRGLEV